MVIGNICERSLDFIVLWLRLKFSYWIIDCPSFKIYHISHTLAHSFIVLPSLSIFIYKSLSFLASYGLLKFLLSGGIIPLLYVLMSHDLLLITIDGAHLIERSIDEALFLMMLSYSRARIFM